MYDIGVLFPSLERFRNMEDAGKELEDALLDTDLVYPCLLVRCVCVVLFDLSNTTIPCCEHFHRVIRRVPTCRNEGRNYRCWKM